MMHKTKNVNTNTHCHYLKLVSNNSAPSQTEQPELPAANLLGSSETKYLTVAMMNRLWIPQTSTIVGLLGVGDSKDNFDELSKWIAIQLNATPHSYGPSNLQQLERHFRKAIDAYPEI